MKVPTPDQLSTLVKAAEADDPVLATAVALAALTGARRGELVALRWSDIDLTKGRVRIARSLTVSRGEQHIGPTKTHQVRDLALDPVCIEVLRQTVGLHDRSVGPGRLATGARPICAHVQRQRRDPGQPGHPHARVRQAVRALEKPALVELKKTKPKAKRTDLAPGERWPFRFHDLRHFSVTTLIAAGVDVRTVADRHGHARATMTLDRYAHALPERDREAAGLLGQVLRQATLGLT